MAAYRCADFREEKLHIYSHPLHASNLLKALNNGRNNPHLCDGAVVIKGKEIPIQKNILSAASPYFRALFSYQNPSHQIQMNPNLLPIDDLGIEETTFQQILDYIYTSSISLNEENIQDILQAADILLLTDLKELCCDYLEQCISVNNCTGIREFAESFSCARVLHKATEFLDEYFRDISYSEEFLQLPFEKLVPVLQRNTLQIRSEEVLFDSIVRWCRQDETNRVPRAPELLTLCFRSGNMSDYVFSETILKDKFVVELNLKETLLQERLERPRPGMRGFTNVLMVVGGEGKVGDGPDIEVKKHAWCIALPTDPSKVKHVQWIDLAPMNKERLGHGLVEAGGYAYAVGGRNEDGILNSGEKYNPVTNEWTLIAPMNHARVGFGLVVIDDKIYALGGSNDVSDPNTSIEEYNIYTNKWRKLPDMNLKRAWASYAVLDKKIYVIGGGIMGKLYEAVECYDPRSETWVSVAPMKERRFDARSVGIGGNLYVFGGLRRLACPSASHTGAGMKFCDSEVYSVEHKSWGVLSSCRSGLCTMTETSHIDDITVNNNEIFLIGELDVGGMYHFVRAYSPSSDTWRGMIINSPHRQRSVQACMVKMSNERLKMHLSRR